MVNNALDHVEWNINAQTGVLMGVLLGKPDHFRSVPLNSISAVNQANQEQMGYRFDKQKAMQQHRQMVKIYEANGIKCRFVEADKGLPSSVFTRASSFMTPWGAVITSIQAFARRQDYFRGFRVLSKSRHPDLELDNRRSLRRR